MLVPVLFLLKISHIHNTGFFHKNHLIHKPGPVKFSAANISLANTGKINLNTKSSNVYLASMKSRCGEIKVQRRWCTHLFSIQSGRGWENVLSRRWRLLRPKM